MESRNTAASAAGNPAAAGTAGIPYEDIRWFDVEGQPFGAAARFNVMAMQDGDDIVDVEGAMAVGGNFTSYRGTSIAFGRGGNRNGTGYSPDLVRCLIGGTLSAAGPFNVIGHVVVGGPVSVGVGSSYLIGKSGAPDQAAVLAELYANSNGSRYWIPAEYQNHFVISSYDVPRWIPAERIGADLEAFFSDAQVSLRGQRERLLALPVNGETADGNGEWVLRGKDPKQNVFLIDVSKEGGNLSKQMRLEIPDGSAAIVKVRTGPSARVQFGIWGRASTAERTLYLFEDAQTLTMDVPAGIWGSVLAPQMTLNAHKTGGNINGNVVLSSFHVEEGSGFEFHWYPFSAVVRTDSEAVLPDNVVKPALPQARPLQPVEPTMGIPEAARPEPPRPAEPTPGNPEVLPPRPAEPTPGNPEVLPPRNPEVLPPRPAEPTPGNPEVLPPRPAEPAPGNPEAPRPEPPRPEPPVSGIPECPPCPLCPPCPECPTTPGLISGCICECICCCVGCCIARCLPHLWEVRLYRVQGKARWPVARAVVPCCGSFRFEVPADGRYYLRCYPSVFTGNDCRCRPKILLKNVGVSSLVLG